MPEPERKKRVSCVLCKSTNDLAMFAHRDEAGYVVGWVFACPKCSDEVAGNCITITFGKMERQ